MRVLLIIAFLIVASAARAELIFSDGFENPALSPGTALYGQNGSNNTPPNWTVAGYGGHGGFYNPTGYGRFNHMVDGQQYAFIQPEVYPGTRLVHDTGRAARGGATYALSVAVGEDLLVPYTDTWQIELYSGAPFAAGSTLLGFLNAQSQGAVLPTLGEWAFNTLTVTANQDGGDLFIALAQIELANGSHTASFDAVSLSALSVPVPEPASFVLLGVALLAVAAGHRTKTGPLETR